MDSALATESITDGQPEISQADQAALLLKRLEGYRAWLSCQTRSIQALQTERERRPGFMLFL